MLHPSRLRQALQQRRPDLEAALHARADAAAAGQAAFRRLSALNLAEATAALRPLPWPGARPTAEHALYPRQVLPAGLHFTDQRQARRWASTALQDQTTFAVDGSQLSLADDLHPPVAAAQVGWFVNHHSRTEPHAKDVRLDILLDEDQRRIDVRRFEMEVARALELMSDLSALRPAPLCLLDDPLVVPFATEGAGGRLDAYVHGISALVERSEALRVPLLGYTADPSARDLSRMLHSLDLLPAAARPPDALCVGPALPAWGDRTCLYVCARAGAHLEDYCRQDGTSLSAQILFCYMRLTADGWPARLEMPRWLAEDAVELERVLNLVRAECVAGMGYPYVLQAAHDAAVITGGERTRFARTFARYCDDIGVQVGETTKAVSKRRRRRGG